MLKKAFYRGRHGFLSGIAIGHILSIIVSLNHGDGVFYPCAPDLISAVGNEMNAVILQTFLYGVIGTSFSASTVVWDIENWSIAAQTGAYFLINALVVLPSAYVLSWMEHSLMGFLTYFGVFTFYFALIWMIKYFACKRAIKKMNAKLQSRQ